MFDGKLKDFRHEGGVVKTDEEKRQMAQKHRFKKEREFKQRLEETEQNEEADIRTFTFHHHDLEKRNDRSIRSNWNKQDDREDRRGGKKEKGGRFDRGDRKFNKAERNFAKKRRFEDDEED